jgi:plastocyanin
MTDWDLMTPGIGLTSLGIVGVAISLSGIANTFMDGMHAVSLLTMFIGMIFLASGLFKDGFPMSGKAKSATFITLGFLVTFGFAGAVTVSTQVPSIYAYIGLMLIISIPATVLAVASYRGAQYLKAMAVIFIGAAIVGGSTFYAFGLVAPRPEIPEEEPEGAQESPAANDTGATPPPANTISATILPGSSAEGNPAYEPDPLTVSRGDGIEWTNEDNAPHTVTSSEEGIFDSGIMDPEARWLLNSADLEPGEYEYYCTLHPFMIGMLIISEDGATPDEIVGQTETQSSATTNQSGTLANQTALTGGSTNNNTSADSSEGLVATTASVTTVSIVAGGSVPTNNEFYDPEDVESAVGSMITWINDDTAPHTVTSGIVEDDVPAPDGGFDSGMMEPGDSFPFVFDQVGEYPYYCTVHPWMTGKVTVSSS